MTSIISQSEFFGPVTKTGQDHLALSTPWRETGNRLKRSLPKRWHQTLKNRILYDNYFFPADLKAQIEAFFEHYNHQRYHESLDNLIPKEIIITPLMESNPATLAGAVRSSMLCIGQAPQRTRWTDLAHRRPVFRASRTSLCSTCGRPDQGVKHAQRNMGSLEPMLL